MILVRHTVLLLLLFSCQQSSAQFNKRHQDISNKDLIEALQFGGIDIFKFTIDSLNSNYDFLIVVDEYDSTRGRRRVDTLLTGETAFREYRNDGTFKSGFISQFRFLTKVLQNDFGIIYLQIGTTHISTYRTLRIDHEYARKHYWVRFRDQRTEIGKTIPLLFFGSEWIETIDGKETTRYCSRSELDAELSDPTIQFIPHYFVIGYEFKARE